MQSACHARSGRRAPARRWPRRCRSVPRKLARQAAKASAASAPRHGRQPIKIARPAVMAAQASTCSLHRPGPGPLDDFPLGGRHPSHDGLLRGRIASGRCRPRLSAQRLGDPLQPALDRFADQAPPRRRGPSSRTTPFLALSLVRLSPTAHSARQPLAEAHCQTPFVARSSSSPVHTWRASDREKLVAAEVRRQRCANDHARPESPHPISRGAPSRSRGVGAEAGVGLPT